MSVVILSCESLLLPDVPISLSLSLFSFNLSLSRFGHGFCERGEEILGGKRLTRKRESTRFAVLRVYLCVGTNETRDASGTTTNECYSALVRLFHCVVSSLVSRFLDSDRRNLRYSVSVSRVSIKKSKK